MQAILLAGGEGTRLRPLTATVPKPVLPLVGRPLLSLMLDWLAEHGVYDVVLSCGFLADGVRAVMGHRQGATRIRYVDEEQPLGTAGPIRLAAEAGILDERFVVVNGDILTDVDLTAQVAAHERRGAVATLGLVAVADTASYGVVPTTAAGEVEAFLEKSDAPPPTNRVNGGVYVLERQLVEAIPPGRAVSFEREVFPELVGRGLFGYALEGYWIDIGTPERYLAATYDLLSGVVRSTLPPRDQSGSLVASSSVVAGARIGPHAVVGEHCSVGAGATIERAVLHEGVRVGEECQVCDSVVAAGARLGDGARVEAGALIGAGARVAAGAVVGAAERVEPSAEVAGTTP